MIQKLTKHGKKFALLIDQDILDLLGIDAKTPLSITTDGQQLIITKAAEDKLEKRLGKVLKTGNRRYARMLKRLAD